MNRIVKATLSAVAAATMLGVGTTSVVTAAPPVVVEDSGAYVRLVGNPSQGTVKFQYGWGTSTPSSAAAGYWLGIYDVTNSHYVWSFDTGPIPSTPELFLNAKPTTKLPNGEYKVVMFVRATYNDPVTNIAAIEVPFTVDHGNT